LLLPASEGESLRQPRQIQSPVPPQGDKQAKDAKQAKSDKELIQGEWMVESAIDDGAELPAEIREQVRFFVKGDSMTVKIVELEDKGTYTVQENKTPKTVDLKLESGTNLIGIYEFFGDKVKLCLVLEDKDTKRPTEFKSVGGSGHKLVVLARVKEEKKKDQVAGDTTYLFHQLFVERFVHVRPDAEFRVR
jgi:uncharacterized protein (TIGR03067 family)